MIYSEFNVRPVDHARHGGVTQHFSLATSLAPRGTEAGLRTGDGGADGARYQSGVGECGGLVADPPCRGFGERMQAEESVRLFPREGHTSRRCLAAINAAFLASGLGALLVSYMAVDTVVACLAVALGLCCMGIGVVGLASQWLGRLRLYGVMVGVASLLGLWFSLIAWFRGDMALRFFEKLAASDWEAYFDTLGPSFRRQVLAQHSGCDAEYSESCWDAVREHTTHKYFSAARVCVPAALSLAAGALVSLNNILGSARLVDDLDQGLNYIVLVFGFAMVGTAAAEYDLMATWVGRLVCWSAICAGFTLIMITGCSFANRAGSRSPVTTTRAIITASSSVLDLCVFVLAQALFVLAIGCFVAKHTLVKLLHAYLDDHALQDILAEYKQIAGCDDSAEAESESGAASGINCEASKLAWADAELVFRRQLDTIGWSLLLVVLLIVAKLLCGRHVLQLAAADVGSAVSTDDASGVSVANENAGRVLAHGTTKSQYVAVALEEEDQNGISRSSSILAGQIGGSLVSRQASGSRRLVGAAEEHSLMLSPGGRCEDEVTVEDLGDDYRGGMAASDLLSQASIDSADITDFYGPSSGKFAGYSAADLAQYLRVGGEAGDDYGGDQLALASREGSSGSSLGASSPAVGRRGSLQLSIAEQSTWLRDLNRCDAPSFDFCSHLRFNYASLPRLMHLIARPSIDEAHLIPPFHRTLRFADGQGRVGRAVRHTHRASVLPQQGATKAAVGTASAGWEASCEQQRRILCFCNVGARFWLTIYHYSMSQRLPGAVALLRLRAATIRG